MRLAGQTGGVAYFGRNDLDVAISRRPSRTDAPVIPLASTNPSDRPCASSTHRLAVDVLSWPGILPVIPHQLSGRKRRRQVSSTTKADFGKALGRPIDATAIPVKAVVTRAQDRLNVQALLGVEGLDLTPDQNRWTGEDRSRGPLHHGRWNDRGGVLSQTMTLNLRQISYDAALRDGLSPTTMS